MKVISFVQLMERPSHVFVGSKLHEHVCGMPFFWSSVYLNTIHDNNRENRHQERGGSIANINADGTFTHVDVVEEEDDNDN